MRGLSSAKLVAATAGGLLLVPFATAVPASAAEVTTPYPEVAVEPGETTTIDLDITSDESESVELSVPDAPEGWNTVLRGGGREIGAVHVAPDAPGEVQLDVTVPADAGEGSHQIRVQASAGSGNDTLPLTLNIVEQAAEAFELTTEFPTLNGTVTDTFSFDLELANRSGQEATFNLAAAGPQGWQVQARPSTEQQASTVTVDAGGTSTINVQATPPENAPAGQYEIGVRAEGEGQTLSSTLGVEITGSPAISITTPNEQLNASGGAGSAGNVQLVVTNDGNAPLQGVELSASPPNNWDVEFDPATINIAPGQSTQVTARVTPNANTIAGDYTVTMSAAAEGIEESADIRYTVETSGWWGLVAVLVIAAALAALFAVYRRYGRR